MLVEKVQVTGDVQSVYQHLLTTLQAHRYEIEQQIPDSQIVARRGNKLSNLLLSTPRHGFRELDVILVPSGAGSRSIEVTFTFTFPSWSVKWPPINSDCRAMIEQFVRRAGSDAAPTGAVRSDGILCAACQASNPPGALFCRGCGGKLEPPRPASVAAVESLTCDTCQAANSGGSAFCCKCGTKLKPRAAPPAGPAQEPTCGNCKALLPPGAQFCGVCGTRV